MLESKRQSYFSEKIHDINRPFLASKPANVETLHIGFILLEHFSMMAFTAAVDALVTANLVSNTTTYKITTHGLSTAQVLSDLNIKTSTDSLIEQMTIKNFNALIVCGGYRCDLSENPALSNTLMTANKLGIFLGGLWNGAIQLAQAGLLQDEICALHPENHAFLQEKFSQVHVSKYAFAIGDGCATSAGPNSSLEMMLKLIESASGPETVRAIREILSCDQQSIYSQKSPVTIDRPELPDSLRTIVELMAANTEEPLSLSELSAITSVSRRQIERLFQNHLEISPSRYYLDLRLTRARQLLQQTSEPITNIAVACGFLTSAHFSRCFKEYFGTTPTGLRLANS